MLLASNIGFLALVAPAQISVTSFDPEREMESNDGYRLYMIKITIYQCLINTYYAASFVFCFASSSIFRREINKLLNKHYKPKHSLTSGLSEAHSPHENRPFLQQARLSGVNCSNSSPNNDYIRERTAKKRATESTIETDGLV
jgi:hypothetical protein